MINMKRRKLIEWILRIGLFGEFFGHGILGILGKKEWLEWFSQFGIADPDLARTLLFFVGVLDVTLAIFVLVKPFRPFLIWMAIWGFWTALLRPIVGEPIWDFIERSSNWAAPIALYLLLSLPKEEQTE